MSVHSVYQLLQFCPHYKGTENTDTRNISGPQNITKMRLRPTLCPGPRWEHRALPDPLADLGREGKGKGGEGRAGEGRAGKGKGITHKLKVWLQPRLLRQSVSGFFWGDTWICPSMIDCVTIEIICLIPLPPPALLLHVISVCRPLTSPLSDWRFPLLHRMAIQASSCPYRYHYQQCWVVTRYKSNAYFLE